MPKSKVQYVYFIADPRRQAVKVGIALDPQSRLKQLQTGSSVKLRLLGYVPGGREREQAIHRELEAHQVQGEWFEQETVLSWLRTLPADEWVMLSPPRTTKRSKKRWSGETKRQAKAARRSNSSSSSESGS